jgi:Zn-dependent M28 family amino/carboxypeptidase
MGRFERQRTPRSNQYSISMMMIKIGKSKSKSGRAVRSLYLILSVCLLPSLVLSLSRKQVSIGLESIQSERIRATLSFLASEHFKGRGTGTPEAGLTAAYIASVFQRNGLHPLEKDNQLFVQSFELCQALPQEQSLLQLENPDGSSKTSFKFREEFLPAPWDSDTPAAYGDAVFAGYGIAAKEHQYDDYAELDVSGKIVVVLSKFPDNAKSSFDRLSPADYEDPMAKVLQAQRLGAIGALVILSVSEELPATSELNFKKARTYLAGDVRSIKIPAAFVPFSIGEKIVQRKTAQGITSLAEIKQGIDTDLRPQSFSLGGKLRIETSYERKSFTGQNVMGVISGSDPSLRDEFLILGAHFDHLGIGENNEIFYGADDDASGVTALLELAEAFRGNPVKPRRSVVLAAWGAEEVGLLGSKYFAQNPLVPLRKIIAMIQMDMIGRNAERSADAGKNIEEELPANNTKSLNVMGSPFSQDLRSVLELCNQEVGLDLHFRFDFGSDNLNKRSDHWTFLREGIPSLLLFTGFHADYHRVTDTADKINYTKMEKILKLVYLTSWDLADAPRGPKFDGSPFEH